MAIRVSAKKQAPYKVMFDESSNRIGLYRIIKSDVPGSATGWEQVATVEDFKLIRRVLGQAIRSQAKQARP